MPFTTAFWNEVPRLPNSCLSVQFVTVDTGIGGMTMHAGNRLIVPYQQLYTNTTFFGQHSMQFNIASWLKKDNLEENSYRHFGGMIWHCPGWDLAKQETFMVLACLLYRCGVEVAPVSINIDWKAGTAVGSR